MKRIASIFLLLALAANLAVAQEEKPKTLEEIVKDPIAFNQLDVGDLEIVIDAKPMGRLVPQGNAGTSSPLVACHKDERARPGEVLLVEDSRGDWKSMLLVTNGGEGVAIVATYKPDDGQVQYTGGERIFRFRIQLKDSPEDLTSEMVKRFDSLLEELSHEEYEVREAAMAGLVELGPLIQRRLRDALSSDDLHPEAEGRIRLVQKMLQKNHVAVRDFDMKDYLKRVQYAEAETSVNRPLLGITRGAALPQGTKGVIIGAVIPGASAEVGGFKEGDLILEFAGKEIATWDDLVEQIGAHDVGDEITATVRRPKNPKIPPIRETDGEEVKIVFKLGVGAGLSDDKSSGLGAPVGESL